MIYQGHDNEGHKFRSVAAGGGFTDDMTITGGGNVGIGTTSPSRSLHVLGQSGIGTVLKLEGASGTTTYLQLAYNGATNSQSGYIGYDSSANMPFFTNNTERVRIQSDGNVGIGVTSPGAKLDVNGHVYIRTGYNLYVDTLAGYASNVITLAANTNFIVPSGNVGIGTTAPGTRLEIRSTAADADRTIPHNVLTITAEQGNAPYGFFGGAILFKNRSYVSGIVESSRIRSVIYDDGAPNNFGGGLWFETTPTPGGALTSSLVINYQGRVGIGTTSPTRRLDVNGTSIFRDFTTVVASNGNSVSNITWLSTDSGIMNIYSGGTSTVQLNSNGVSYLNGGNVGIGTTLPGQRLAVQGELAKYTTTGIDGTFDSWIKYGYFNDLQSGATNPNRYHGFDGSLTAGTAVSNVLRVRLFGGGDNNNAPVTVADFRGNLSTVFYGDVGIGTTSPLSRLHIVGSAADNVGLAMFQNEQNAGGTYFPAANFINTRGNHSYGIVAAFRTNTAGDGDRPSIIFYGAQTAASWTVGQSNSSWGTADAFAIGYRASNDPDGFTGWPSNYFTILTGGNVGIGSTSPAYKLEVAGTIGIGGNTIPTANNTYTLGGGSNKFSQIWGARFFADDGSAGSPSYTFAGDQDSGFFKPGDGTLATTINGVERMRIDGSNLGINTTTPQYRLDVNGGTSSGFAASFGGQISPGVFSGIHFGYLEPGNTSYRKSALVFERTDNHSQGGNASGKIYMLLDNRSSVSATTLSAAVMTWDTDAVATLGSARVGVGSTSPAYTLDVAGTIRATGDVIAYSDARVKDNVKTIDAPLDIVKSLRGVTYTRKDTDDKSEKVGVIAQEVLPILPQVVQKDTNGNYSVAYGNMVGVLIEAIKEQQRQIDELKYLLQNK
jgi:hypothetical protein